MDSGVSSSSTSSSKPAAAAAAAAGGAGKSRGGLVETDVNLGFVETEFEETEQLESHHLFVEGKIGGRPMWLTMDPLPTTAQLTCQSCQQPLSFLLQIYAPLQQPPPHSFHRSLYIFICRNGKCSEENSPADTMKVFRCDLERKNKFYAFDPIEPSELADQTPKLTEFQSICFICGVPGSKRCSRCNKVWYCHKLHQAYHWKNGHKAECSSEDPIEPNPKLQLSSILFPQYLISIGIEELDKDFQIEDDDDDLDDCSDEEDVLEDGEEQASEGDKRDVKDLKAAASKADPFFLRFKRRLQQNDDQVIRYEWNGKPLWAGKDLPEQIPHCQLCGAERHFEFQVTPQLLSHLDVDIIGQSIDWATLVVFTCSKSCQIADSGYAEEFVYRQDFK